MEHTPLVAMKGIVKRYPGVVALNRVDLEVEPGEVMALVGENGAGKSTLLKVLAGSERADEGRIEVLGQPLVAHTPRESLDRGICVIYQELNLANDLSVAENVFVGREPTTKLGTVDFRTMRRRTRELLRDLDIDVSPDAIVGDLNIALRQMVEIAKSLLIDARLVVMDEPTSSLTEEEVVTLFALVRRLKANGVSVIYVSHRMREVEQIADRVTVMRDGAIVGVAAMADTTQSQIVRMMVGRDLGDLYGTRTVPVDTDTAPALEVHHLGSTRLLHDVSFAVHRGEILAIAGLIGAGRSTIARTIFGTAKRVSGEVLVEGVPLNTTGPTAAMARGIAFVPEDRKLLGLFLQLTSSQNMSAASLRETSKGPVILRRRERELFFTFAARLGLRMSAGDVPVGTLSGGNQQKVLLARWLARHPAILILDEPTRGVDVGAKAEIYGLIRSIAADGVAVVVISSELPEVLGISDRIVVMREGYGVGELDTSQASEEAVMALATGVQEAPQ